jgi:hypothetical protein
MGNAQPEPAEESTVSGDQALCAQLGDTMALATTLKQARKGLPVPQLK